MRFDAALAPVVRHCAALAQELARLIAADHGPRSRGEVMELAFGRLLAG